jgi:CheY-like chemotaxis protein
MTLRNHLAGCQVAVLKGGRMSSLRVLHVDDEPDIREVVEMSLGLDPEFAIRSCASGADAISASADWPPDLILLDVMMPVMDGPTTLKHLRQREQTSETPVVFMTARAQAREIEAFVSLGAVGVIPKPFDPMTLATSVRNFVRPSKAALAALREGFMQRARNDAAALSHYRVALLPDGHSVPAIEQIKTIAHGLSGAGGIFGFPAISEKATTLAQASEAMLAGTGAGSSVARALDDLCRQIERE